MPNSNGPSAEARQTSLLKRQRKAGTVLDGAAAKAASAKKAKIRGSTPPNDVGLMLPVADNKTGYFGVYHHPGKPKPYQAQVKRGGKQVNLGSFATAEEAALCFARSPEGRAAAQKAAASEQGNAPALPSGATLKEEGMVPLMPPGAFVKEEGAVPPMPPGAFVKEEGVVPPMPPDALVKREHKAVVKEEERSYGRAKRRRSK